jgi:hypothetical protein
VTDVSSLPIKKLLKNTSFNLVISHIKTRKFLLPWMKTKTMTSFFETSSYDSPLNNIVGVTSFSTYLSRCPF